jgi:hypothetical protein
VEFFEEVKEKKNYTYFQWGTAPTNDRKVSIGIMDCF